MSRSLPGWALPNNILEGTQVVRMIMVVKVDRRKVGRINLKRILCPVMDIIVTALYVLAGFASFAMVQRSSPPCAGDSDVAQVWVKLSHSNQLCVLPFVQSVRISIAWIPTLVSISQGSHWVSETGAACCWVGSSSRRTSVRP